MAEPGDLDARGRSCCTAPTCRASRSPRTSAGLHHKIAHVLGGTFNLVHADAHSVRAPARRRVQRAGRCRPRWRASPRRSERPARIRRGACGTWPTASNVPTSLAALGPRARPTPRGAPRAAAAEITDNPRTCRRGRRCSACWSGAVRRSTSRRQSASTEEHIVSHESYIVDAVRTPIGRIGGALAGVRPDDLAATVGAGAGRTIPDLDPVRDRRGRTSATPTRRARTTATSPGWRCCWRACRRRSRGRP